MSLPTGDNEQQQQQQEASDVRDHDQENQDPEADSTSSAAAAAAASGSASGVAGSGNSGSTQNASKASTTTPTAGTQQQQQQHQQQTSTTSSANLLLPSQHHFAPPSAHHHHHHHLYAMPSASVSPVHAAAGPSSAVGAAASGANNSGSGGGSSSGGGGGDGNTDDGGGGGGGGGTGSTAGATGSSRGNPSNYHHHSSLSHSSFFDSLGHPGTQSQHQHDNISTTSPQLLLDIPPFSHEDFQTNDTKDVQYDYYNLDPSQHELNQSPHHHHQQQQQHPQHHLTHHHNVPRQSTRQQQLHPSQHHHHLQPQHPHQLQHHQQQQQQQHANFLIDQLDPMGIGHDNSDLVLGSYTTSPSNLFKRKDDMEHAIPVAKRQRLDDHASPSLQMGTPLSGDPAESLHHANTPPSNLRGSISGLSSTSKRPLQRSSAWTRHEEDRLQELVDAGVKWSDITREFPNRSAGAIKKHYYADMKHTSWNEEEDVLLQQSVREDDEAKWRRISEKVGKPAKACENECGRFFVKVAAEKDF